MELTVYNYSGQPLMLFTSDNYYDKSYLQNNVPSLSSLLSSISDQSWLSSLEDTIYADKVDKLVNSVKNVLSPQLLYQDFILAGDVAFLNNIFSVPNYIYCVGITTVSSRKNAKLGLTFNVFASKSILGKFDKAEDLISSIKIYLGKEGKFYCDDVTPDGEKVCNVSLPKSSRFINDMYSMRHNPRLFQVDSVQPVSGDFDKSMIENINITDHYVIKDPEIANPIPSPGLDGQTVVAYLYFGDTSNTLVAKSDTSKQSFTLEQRPNTWASIAVLLFVLLIIAIVIGIIVYLANKGSINIFNGKGETPNPIMI